MDKIESFREQEQNFKKISIKDTKYDFTKLMA